MKLSHLLLTTSLCAVAAVPAMAQSRTFSSIDANGDGQLSLAELEAVFGRQGAGNILNRSDLDRNGFVSASEIKISHDDDSNDDDTFFMLLRLEPNSPTGEWVASVQRTQDDNGLFAVGFAVKVALKTADVGV